MRGFGMGGDGRALRDPVLREAAMVQTGRRIGRRTFAVGRLTRRSAEIQLFLETDRGAGAAPSFLKTRRAALARGTETVH